MANPRNLAKIAPIVSATAGKLILSDTATFNGETANSLVYLNANKEATTVSTLSFDGSRVGINTTTPGSTLDVKGILRLTGSSSGYVGLQAATTGSSVTYTLPASDGLNGQVLQTNGVGSLSWVNQSAGGGGGSSGSGTSTSRTAFTATEGQTTFSVEYVVGQVDVYLNGSKLIANNDFTATSGNTVVLAVGATAGSVVEAVVYSSQWITSGTNLYYSAGNIGVGTTNPAAKVHAASANTAFAVGTIRIDGADSAGTVNAPVTINAATGGATGNGGSQLYFETRADGGALTERLRIDHRGNVGLGVAPSAWTWNNPATGAAFDIGSVGSFFSLASQVGVGTEITRNAYFTGSSWVHKTDGAASRFEQSGGTFRWFSAPSLFAGNTAAFTEYMRLTSDGKLGINITSPSVKLHVENTGYGTSFIASAIAETASQVNIGIGVLTVGRPFIGTNTNSNPLEIGTRAATETIFVTNSTEKMRIQSNGSVLVGASAVTVWSERLNVTASDSPVANFNSTSASGGYSIWSANGTAYGFIGTATGIIGSGGSNALAVRSENALMFASGGAYEKMRITSDGQLLIGATSASQGTAGSIRVPSGAFIHDNSFARFWLRPGQQIGSATYAGLYGPALTYLVKYNSGWKSTGGGNAGALTIDEGIFSFSNSNSLSASDESVTWNTRMIIDHSGSVGFGTSTPAARIHGEVAANTNSVVEMMRLTDNVYCDFKVLIDRKTTIVSSISRVNTASGIMAFETSNTERARIDTSGNLIIGKTTLSNQTNGILLNASGTQVNSFAITNNQAFVLNNTTAGTTYSIAFRTNDNERGSISVTDTAASFNTTSDYRLKENEQPIPNVIERFKKLKPYRFNWKENGEVDEGFFAHELAEVCPKLVLGEKDQVDETGKIKAQSVDYGKLTPFLTAVISNLLERIEQLESKLESQEIK